MMTTTIKLADVLHGMEVQSEQYFAYIDRETGRVVEISDEEIRAAEDDALAADAPDWQEPGIDDARAILDDEKGRYLPVPDRFEIDEWSLMRKFSERIEDESACEQLLAAIHGRGAFRMFKDTIHRLGLVDDWHAYRDARYREIAIEWCRMNNLAFDESA